VTDPQSNDQTTNQGFKQHWIIRNGHGCPVFRRDGGTRDREVCQPECQTSHQGQYYHLFQVTFFVYHLLSFLYSGFTDNPGFTVLMESHKARETSAIKLITRQGYAMTTRSGKIKRWQT